MTRFDVARPAGPGPAVPDPVGVLVADLDRRLRGPRRLRRDLLAELRDGLEDAADAHVRRGAAPAVARELAVRDFGPPAEVAADCQRELTASHARRAALVISLVAPAVELLWAGWYPQLSGHPHPGTLRDLRSFVTLPHVQAAVVWLVTAAAVHQFVLLGRGRGVTASRVVGGLGAALVMLVGGLSAAMTALDGGSTVRVLAGSPGGWVLGLVSVGMLMATGTLAWRTVSLNRHAARCLRTPLRERVAVQ